MNKKIFTLLLGILLGLNGCKVQNAVKLTAYDISNSATAKKINANASALLTELNQAFAENRMPQLAGIGGISKDAISSIMAMWEATGSFRCAESKITERGLHLPGGGYQVRNIPVVIKDVPENAAAKVIAINFDSNGNIEDMYFSIETDMYEKIMKGDVELSRRLLIISFLDRYRDAYVRKDIEMLAKVYSDDALIITGKVIRKTQSTDNILAENDSSNDKITHRIPSKQEYIRNLSKTFASSDSIDVQVEDIKVMQHPEHKNLYAVQVKQHWTSGKKEGDKGYLFLLIDFKDGVDMEILSRTWQPAVVNGKPLSDDKIYNLENFKIK